MGKYQESFGRINLFFKGKLGRSKREYPFDWRDLALLEELVIRATPDRPVGEVRFLETDEGRILFSGECGCGEISFRGANFCRKCGKALDWGETFE